MHSRLLAKLVSRLGQHQAYSELNWMKQALQLPSSPTLDEMVSRRSLGEPLQYILGSQPFGPLNLLARPPVLIPRPETEHWVIKLSKTLSPTAQTPLSMIDLGTGSGCIPLLLCHLWPAGSLCAHAFDISPHAINLANDNASLCGIPSVSDPNNPQNTFKSSRANFLDVNFPGKLLDAAIPIDLLTSNPPYIPWDEYLELPRSVVDYEDPRALFGGPHGLEFYHAIMRLLCHNDIFGPNAFVALEVGHQQAESVEALLRSTGRFRHLEIWTDPWGKKRTVIACM